jgi:hypothetical protein
MDFFQISVKERKGGGLEAYPDFIVGRSEDLMVRAKNFYAVWDEVANKWSTDEYDVQRLVDAKLKAYAETNKDVTGVKYMRNFSSNGQSTFRKYMSQIGENSHQLDETLTFQSTKVSKKDYVSKRLPYDLSPGDHSAWDELVGTLYGPEEKAKIEWAFGAIVSGDSKKIQKFLVLEGPPGAGKGTIINIAMMLFDGYYTTFNAKALGSSGNQFASAAFAGNPLLAIQHDGDLSKIEDNTILNSIISHEVMRVNEKYKPDYDARINAFLIMGTNKPVKITDSQSGLIRRLIDVHPTGNILPPKKYHALMAQIEFSLGAIAHHCLQVYQGMGKNYYSNYRPLEMMYKTNAFFNFIETYYDIFEKQGGTSAKQAWQLYKDYCEEANIDRPMKLHEFRSELGTYFEEFHDRITLDGVLVRSYYARLKTQPFKMPVDDKDLTAFTLRMDETTSLLNLELADYPAQYAKADGSPTKYWDDSERIIGGELKKPKPTQVVATCLRELDPYKAHYVKVPENMIVIDFDLKDADGKKSLERNLAAASEWPPTYGELSRSGQGVHLHYYYDGDPERLDPAYSDGIEIKRYSGNSALRRRLTLCNSVPISSISSGLPLKEKTRVLDPGTMKSEKALRDLIARNLRKEIHPGTKPSIDFIKKILDDAYEDGLSYDVSDLYPKVVSFANNSTNKSLECLKIVQTMRWKSEEDIPETPVEPSEKRLSFIDCEVYPNLFVVCWKFQEPPGVKPSADNVVRMINPKPHEIEALIRLMLVGFHNRNYDNHILWGAALGFNNQQLYNLSTKIINGMVGAKFGEAYKISYTDVYDYSTKKQGLKKWQIELGLPHREMDIPWDQPVPENRIMDVVDYCVNDVVSLEEVHNHLQGDFKARLILADLSGLTPNDTTAKHTAAIVFGREKNPQRDFVYTDLSKEFPGYVFDPMAKTNKSTYRGEVVGEGGYVYAEPGIHQDVALLDVASMHPTSIGQLNLFGEYTPRFMALVNAQLAIKHGDYAAAKEMLDGKLIPYLEDIEELQRVDPAAAKKAAADLRYGLKIAINIVYGLTSAKFDNPFKDIRNLDNIVAKRGALFMIDLKHFIQDRGFKVVHIKTDSVKIPGATPELIEEVVQFADKYGYSMEHEATYDRFALVNDAVYVARTVIPAKVGEDNRDAWKVKWSATGAQYQHPYVFKKLFGYEDDIDFNDLCETKHVQQGSLHLDFGLHDFATSFGGHDTNAEAGYIDAALDEMKILKKNGASEEELAKIYADAIGKLIFVGKTGRFTPVKEGYGGGLLWRVKDGKAYAVQGTKGYFWVDAVVGRELPGDAIDYDYFDALVVEAYETLAKFLEGSGFDTVDEFLS